MNGTDGLVLDGESILLVQRTGVAGIRPAKSRLYDPATYFRRK
jgi:hypothetical protein